MALPLLYLVLFLILHYAILKQIAMSFLSQYKFKVYPKKLSSGKCQVKFVVRSEEAKEMYGYILVDSKVTLKEVIENLEYQLKTRPYKPYFLNSFILKGNTQTNRLTDYLFFNHNKS